jgi:predicted dithiol-disulfide oxidoreductase (DUF899 family)
MRVSEVATQEEWLAARRALLEREKELTRLRDAVAAERRSLPMVEVTADYVFDGVEGPAGLADLFEGRRQLLVYHFMYEPEWDAGCPSCTFIIDNVGHQSHLHARDTTLALVSRAPLAKLEAYKRRLGWDDITWYSSEKSSFNLDYGVTIDATHSYYNFRDRTGEEGWVGWSGDMPGVSAFLRVDDRIYHTYSAYERGVEPLMGTYVWLDLTALGRQEDWEQPPGNGDGNGMAWLHRHDEYPEPSPRS